MAGRGKICFDNVSEIYCFWKLYIIYSVLLYMAPTYINMSNVMRVDKIYKFEYSVCVQKKKKKRCKRENIYLFFIFYEIL